MRTRIFTLLFAFLAMMPSVGWGQSVWDGSIATQFSGGTGTEKDPYQISNGGELAYLAQLVNENNSEYSSAYYILTEDIVLNSGECEDWENSAPAHEWTPIGYYNNNQSAF